MAIILSDIVEIDEKDIICVVQIITVDEKIDNRVIINLDCAIRYAI